MGLMARGDGCWGPSPEAAPRNTRHNSVYLWLILELCLLPSEIRFTLNTFYSALLFKELVGLSKQHLIRTLYFFFP